MLMVCSHINPKFSCRFKWQEGKGEQELNLVFLKKKKKKYSYLFGCARSWLQHTDLLDEAFGI